MAEETPEAFCRRQTKGAGACGSRGKTTNESITLGGSEESRGVYTQETANGAGNRWQKTGGRKQGAENRGQKTGGRKQRAENRG